MVGIKNEEEEGVQHIQIKCFGENYMWTVIRRWSTPVGHLLQAGARCQVWRKEKMIEGHWKEVMELWCRPTPFFSHLCSTCKSWGETKVFGIYHFIFAWGWFSRVILYGGERFFYLETHIYYDYNFEGTGAFGQQ